MKRPLWEGFRDTIPLGIGVVLYGVVYGMLGRQGGVPFWFILGMSLLVFAGSSQMAAVELLVSGAGPLSTVLTIFVVNLRHVVMGADLSRFLTGAKGRERAVNAFFLTDEVYAVTYTHFRSSPLPSAGRRDMAYMRGSGLCIYSFWALSGAAGYLGGQLVPPAAGAGAGLRHVGGIPRHAASPGPRSPHPCLGAGIRCDGGGRLSVAAGKVVHPAGGAGRVPGWVSLRGVEAEPCFGTG